MCHTYATHAAQARRQVTRPAPLQGTPHSSATEEVTRAKSTARWGAVSLTAKSSDVGAARLKTKLRLPLHALLPPPPEKKAPSTTTSPTCTRVGEVGGEGQEMAAKERASEMRGADQRLQV
jgi:hypothetical protein